MSSGIDTSRGLGRRTDFAMRAPRASVEALEFAATACLGFRGVEPRSESKPKAVLDGAVRILGRVDGDENPVSIGLTFQPDRPADLPRLLGAPSSLSSRAARGEA